MDIHAGFVENMCWESIIEFLPLGVVLTWDINGEVMAFLRCCASFFFAYAAQDSKTDQE